MPLPAPHGSWLKPAYTQVTQTLVTCEKPLLVVDDQDTWSVRLPALARMTGEISWQAGQTPGRDTPLSEFYIARPDRDTAASMNAQLAQGKHLLLTPGIYDLTEPLRVSRANTLVLGLGFATLRPTRGAAAILTSDVDGVMIAGLLFEAGPQL